MAALLHPIFWMIKNSSNLFITELLSILGNSSGKCKKFYLFYFLRQLYMTDPKDLTYFVTVSFKSEQIRNALPIVQIKKTLLYIYNKCFKHCSFFRFTMELTLNMALHYHIIYIPSSKGDMADLITCFRKLGNTKNEIIKSYKNVSEYLIKDLSCIAHIINKYYKTEYVHSDFIFESDNPKKERKFIKKITSIKTVTALL